MVKSAKGKTVNMAELVNANGNAVALGNSNKNARGDIVTKGGKVIKTREQLANEYHTKGTNLVKNVPLDDSIGKIFETPTVDNAEPVTPKKKK